MKNEFPWHNNFTGRQIKEINYCLVYDTDEFQHGTDGHNSKLIIAQMAMMLNKLHLSISGGTFSPEVAKIMGYKEEKE